MYELRSIITAHLHRGQGPGPGPAQGQGLGVVLDTRLLNAEWALLECKLLWKKGLLSAARDHLMSLVVSPLRPVVDGHNMGQGRLGKRQSKGQGLGQGRGQGQRQGQGQRHGEEGSVDTYVAMMSDLLSNALRTGGEVR